MRPRGDFLTRVGGLDVNNLHCILGCAYNSLGVCYEAIFVAKVLLPDEEVTALAMLWVVNTLEMHDQYGHVGKYVADIYETSVMRFIYLFCQMVSFVSCY